MISMDDLAKYTGWVVAVFTTAWGMWNHIQNRKSEKELHEQKRHAEFPIFRLCQDTFQRVFELDENGELFIYQFGSAQILSIQHKDAGVDFPAGENVILVLEDMDVSAIVTSIKMGDKSITMHREPDFDGSSQRNYLKYPFDPAMHGKRQEIKIVMKSRSGVPDTHTYETFHGLWRLHRIDPTLE